MWRSVSDAYAIASNYLRRTGAIADTFATNERLLEIIVQLFQRGEFNKIRLANKAISQVRSRRTRLNAQRRGFHGSRHRPHHADLRSPGEPQRRRQRRGARQGDGLLTKLFEAGEKDTHRLTVCGLTYLRELDGSSDPVKAGFTGL